MNSYECISIILFLFLQILCDWFRVFVAQTVTSINLVNQVTMCHHVAGALALPGNRWHCLVTAGIAW